MKLWQAAWDNTGHLLLWGETGVAQEFTPQIQEEENEAELLATHPCALSSESIVADLEELGFEAEASLFIELTLPSSNGAPLLSPRFLPESHSESEDSPELGVWRLPAVKLHPLEGLAFLTSIPGELPEGLRMDNSVIFWREATKLLLELLTRGRFLPGVVRKNSAWCSHWHILPTDDQDHQRLSVLAEAMPPICRALSLRPGGKSPEPSALLESFISESADALIRAFLARYNLLGELEDKQLPARTALPRKWLASLNSMEPVLEGPEYDLIQFEQRMKSWAGGLLAASQTHHLSTAFRLITPTPAEAADMTPESRCWTVEFLLQSTTDSSQELPAAQLWSGDAGFLQHSEFSLEDLEQRLLRDLGEAVQVFPQLKQALLSTFPTHVELSTAEAYDFLRESSKLLEQHGFVVDLPAWWGEPQTKVGLELAVNSEELESNPLGAGFLAAKELLDFTWNIAIGDQKLDLDSFRKLVERQTPLLQIGGRWVELQPAKLNRTLEFLETQTSQTHIRFVDALRIGLGIEQDEEILPVVGFKASGWIRRLLEADSHKLPSLTEPNGFKGELRPYQRSGLSWMAFLGKIGIGGCLADDMGLGKTVQLLALMLYEREAAKEVEPPMTVGPTLLLVPMSIIANWEEEAARFSPSLRIYVHHGPGRDSGADFMRTMAKTDLVLSTYSLAHRDADLLAQVPWGRLALDEAQNIKNVEAKQTKAVRRLARLSMERPVEDGSCQRVALTGTPLENNLEELWSIFDFLNPGFLGTIKDFRSRFVLPIERYRNKDSAATLNQLIQPFVLRRLKTDPKIISDLPEKMEMEVFTGLTDEQAALYQSMVDQMLPQVERASGMHRKGLVLAAITKLKQICNHPTLFLKDQSNLEGRSGKLNRLVELLEVVLAEGDRVLIFTQYAQMGHLLKPYLQERFGREVLFLHGALPKRAREKVLLRFRDKDGPPIFILSLKAGGFGLNLTEANQVIHFDQWWNPAVEEQATDRAYRIGQLRTVQVRKFICKGTLEEKIHAMLQHKRELAHQVVGSTKNVVTQLSVDELRNLLQLGGN